MQSILRPVLCLLFTVQFCTGGVPVSGVIDLAPPKERRGHLRYGSDGLAEMGPPAPFVGVAYLTPEQAESFTAPAEPAVMEQRGLQFYPAVLPVLVGSKVSFPNLDNTYHNVFSYSPEKRFDLGRYTKDETSPLITFDEAGEVRVFCEVHAHMRAVVLVLETPYFAATDADGRFEIPDVPPGDYQLNIWRINSELETRPLTVAAEPVQVD